MNTIVVGKHLFLIQILYKDNSIAFLLVSDIVLLTCNFSYYYFKVDSLGFPEASCGRALEWSHSWIFSQNW